MFCVRFPNNIAIIRDDTHIWGYGVVWVTDINRRGNSASISGHKFLRLSDMLTEPVPSHMYGSVRVGLPSESKITFDVTAIRSKGMALPMDPLAGLGDLTKKPNSSREWVVDIIDRDSV